VYGEGLVVIERKKTEKPRKRKRGKGQPCLKVRITECLDHHCGWQLLTHCIAYRKEEGPQVKYRIRLA